jgi:ABC-type multidrug transport system, ATPase and permease components
VFEILDEDAEPGVVAKIKSVGEPDRFPHLKRDDTREAVSFPYKPALPIIGDIRYDDVSFSYVDGLSALRHISFHACRAPRLRWSARLARENRRW